MGVGAGGVPREGRQEVPGAPSLPPRPALAAKALWAGGGWEVEQALTCVQLSSDQKQ